MDTNKGFAWDSAVAGLAGAVIGLAVSLALGLSPWLWTPFGAIASFFCYNPLEVWETMCVAPNIVATKWQEMQRNRQTRRQEQSPTNWKSVLTAVTLILWVVFCIVVGYTGIAVAISVLLSLPVGHAVSIELIASCLGLLANKVMNDLLWRYTKSYRGSLFSVNWTWPLLIRIMRVPYIKIYGLSDPDPYEGSRYPSTLFQKTLNASGSRITVVGLIEVFSMTFKLIMVPLMLVSIAVLWIVMAFDVIINCLLALCTTRRLAAVIGGAMGCAVSATISVSCHTTHAPLLLVVGGIVGFVTGPLAYHLRQYLESHPVVIQVVAD